MGNGSSKQKKSKHSHSSPKPRSHHQAPKHSRKHAKKQESPRHTPKQSPQHTSKHSPQDTERKVSDEQDNSLSTTGATSRASGQLTPTKGSRASSPSGRGPSGGSNSVPPQTTHGLIMTDTSRNNSVEPKDVMISYSHQDKEFMRKIKAALEGAGVSVWVDESELAAGAEFLSKIGQAIIDAKLFLPILSPTSLASRYCKDELALAYVSSKPIFPCGLVPFDDLSSAMDFGMRLQLAPLQWIMFTDDRSFDDAFSELISSLKRKLSQLSENSEKKELVTRQSTIRTRINAHHRQVSVTDENKDYWEERFGDREEVPWKEFKDCFQTFVNTEFKDLDLPQEWLLSILAQEVDEEGSQVVDRKTFLDFVTIDGEKIDFKVRVQEQALETYTMHKVFNMESTVRLDAIENLSKFKSSSVIEALLDLCVDNEANVKAVAAISLARAVDDHSNKKVVKVLMHLLKDKDRLVRQSGCLALGHIKATEAVDKLVDIWRNDFISTVREAAEIALKNIGGEEARKAVHITNVLADEIKALGNAEV